MTKEYLEEALEKFEKHEVRAEFVKAVEDKTLCTLSGRNLV